MNKVAAAIAGVVSISLGTLPTLPAVAGTIAFDYSDGYANGTIGTDSALSGLASNILGMDLPESIDFTASDLTGNFSLFEDPAQFLDGDITLDYNLFSNIFGSSIPTDYSTYLPGSLDSSSAQAFADSILNASLTGTGTIDAGGTTTNFNFNYISDSNSIVIDGFDTDVVSQCLTLACTTMAQGNLGLGVELSSISTLNTALNFGLPDEILSFVGLLEAGGLTEIEVASGSFNFGVTTNPGAVDPDGEELYATVTGGDVSVSGIFDGEEVLIADRSFDDTQIVTQAAPQSVPEPGLVFGLLGVGAWMRGKVKRHGN